MERNMQQQDTDTDEVDECHLGRFLEAQEESYEKALSELQNGRKRSHWMWFIFPQIDGLGRSDMAKYYAIKSVEEARAYLNHPRLGKRLLICAETLLGLENSTASAIFGHPDDLKLRSSMTLFARVAEPGSVFDRVIENYFHGQGDARTLELLGD
jgi:uncharacterized protein (DUF1810 family)